MDADTAQTGAAHSVQHSMSVQKDSWCKVPSLSRLYGQRAMGRDFKVINFDEIFCVRVSADECEGGR